jgi:OOP family OmpA-OmpF porin
VREEPITFAPGSAVFSGKSNRVLDELAGLLGRCESGSIEIGGHTDSQGSDSLNLRLSSARAEAVLDGLLERGVPLARLTARGYGDTKPIADNGTEAGRARNRRIEFVAVE